MTQKTLPSVVGRFLKYVSFDTQSDGDSPTDPSTSKQLLLAEALVHELKELGVADARIGAGGVVYGSIAATPGCEANPGIGFIAHMDTSPDAPGADVKPQIVKYEGGDLVLNAEKKIVFSPSQFPDITKYVGEDVIFTDGTTLLGADDKAGIAAIMGMVEYVAANPQVPHAKLCVAFTPDEEIARGTKNFDIEHFGARYAYTFDGGEVGTLESENFNGGTAFVTLKGVGVHPGSSKGRMINSLRRAVEFIERLPEGMSPETTCGYQGFLHPNKIDGTVTSTTIRFIIRDHDRKLYEDKKEILRGIAAKMTEENPRAPVTVEIKDSYENMKPYLDQAPQVLEIVRKAYRAAGLEPIEDPIRGGTDGARLSARGLPCPNVFTGGLNYHGIYECIPVKSLEKACEVAVALAESSAQVNSLKD